MTDPRERFHDLCAAHAVGVLDDADRAEFERLLAEGGEEYAAILAEYQQGAEALAFSVTPAVPSAESRRRLLDEADVPNARRTLLGIAALLLISCGLVIVLRERPKQNTITVELKPTGAGPAGLKATAVVDPDTDEVKVLLKNSKPPSGRDYELWMLRKDQSPKSLGLVSGLAMVEGHAPGAIGFAISLEPKGGAKPKGGPPTGPVVCAGTLP